MAQVRRRVPNDGDMVDWVGLLSDRYKQALDKKSLTVPELIFYSPDYAYDENMKKNDFFDNYEDVIFKKACIPYALNLFRSYYGHNPQNKYDIETVYQLAKKALTDLRYTNVWRPAIVDGVQNHLKFNLYGGYDKSRFIVGKKEEKPKTTYKIWVNKNKLFERDDQFVAHSYVHGVQGSGKSNFERLVLHEAIRNNKWVYTDMSVDPKLKRRYAHLYEVWRLSDLFIDTPEVPSIIRGIEWMMYNHIERWNVLLALDERGEGMNQEEVSSKMQARWVRQFDQVSRHLFVATIEAGKQEKSPLLEEMVNCKILMKGKPTGELNSEGNEKKIVTADVRWKEGIVSEKESTEHIENIPLSGLKGINDRNREDPIDMSHLFSVDFSFGQMMEEISFKPPYNVLRKKCSDFVRAVRSGEIYVDWSADDKAAYDSLRKIGKSTNGKHETEISIES